MLLLSLKTILCHLLCPAERPDLNLGPEDAILCFPLYPIENPLKSPFLDLALSPCQHAFISGQRHPVHPRPWHRFQLCHGMGGEAWVDRNTGTPPAALVLVYSSTEQSGQACRSALPRGGGSPAVGWRRNWLESLRRKSSPR